jgi:prepilin-type processing-associated H-X9-DG protein
VRTLTNHIKDMIPKGGNVLFHDGHVEWRPFSAMYSRYATGTSGLGTATAGKPGVIPAVGVPWGGRIDQWW